MKIKFDISRFKALVLSITLVLGFFHPLIVNATEDEIKNNSDEYNCYAYAIGRFEETKYYWPSDELFPRYQPSEMYKSFPNIYDSYNNDVYTLATMVQSDLIALGYTNIWIYQSAGEDYNINDDEIETYSQMLESINFETQELICVRIEDSIEYHFMKFDAETNAWYNKIGYGSIFKYTDNNGIPSNSVTWEYSGHTYASDIVYIVFNKLKINIANSSLTNENIVVKGGENTYSGKDAFYEIVVPETGDYTFDLSTESTLSFNYEIYSYNMYNGNYILHENGSGNSTTTVSKTVNLVASKDIEDTYQMYKHYIRLDFGRSNTTEQVINVSITHTHEYTNNYEEYSTSQHKAYCWCGEYEIQNHSVFLDINCSLCGAPHTHSYGHHYVWESNTSHKNYCECGININEGHVVRAGALGGLVKDAPCLLCGGPATVGGIIAMSINQLPHTDNGSYILPNGVIVLVDEDAEAYFNGNLEFFDPNNNLET